MKVLLDTNILLAINPKRSKVRGCYDALRAGAYTLVVSTEILEEYAEQLGDCYSDLFAESVMEELLNLDNIEFTPVFPLPGLWHTGRNRRSSCVLCATGHGSRNDVLVAASNQDRTYAKAMAGWANS